MAGIEGHYTNHRLRATTATRRLVNGIPEKIVTERTGHRDVRSLQKYQRVNLAKKVEYTKLFDEHPSVLDKKKDERKNKEHELVCETVVKRKDVEKCASDDGEKKERRRVCFENCTFMTRENFNVE